MSDAQVSAIDWPDTLEQNRSWLTSVLRARLGNSHDVDDVYQEIVLSVLKQASRCAEIVQKRNNSETQEREKASPVPTDREKISPWLYRLAVRHVVNFYRRSNRLTHAKPAADLEPYSESPQPLEWMMKVETQKSLQSAIAKLRPQDREILTLKYNHRWSYQQLADHLGVPVRNIEYRLMNARKRLRNILMVSAPDSIPSFGC